MTFASIVDILRVSWLSTTAQGISVSQEIHHACTVNTGNMLPSPDHI